MLARTLKIIFQDIFRNSQEIYTIICSSFFHHFWWFVRNPFTSDILHFDLKKWWFVRFFLSIKIEIFNKNQWNHQFHNAYFKFTLYLKNVIFCRKKIHFKIIFRPPLDACCNGRFTFWPMKRHLKCGQKKLKKLKKTQNFTIF